MKQHHWLVLGVLVYVAYRFNQSRQGTTALDRTYAAEAASIAAMNGTNFTRSLWDPVSGQPTYMFGTVPVASGTSQYFKTMGPAVPDSIYGHM
jgi:hypothetical protein